jgi:hypothetical protein
VDIIMVNQSDDMLGFIDTHNMVLRDAQGMETFISGRFYFPVVAQFPYFYGFAPEKEYDICLSMRSPTRMKNSSYLSNPLKSTSSLLQPSLRFPW